ncbi:MAG: trigger factor [Chloroflexi bacterium]|nr:MAG: trigger factor [Chloroflexota bacterium]
MISEIVRTPVGGNVKVSVEKLPTSEAVLEVDLTWDELEKASDKAYRKLVQKVDVQGFRRGKAPRSLLERRLGKEYIYQQGLDDLISDTYRNTVKEHELVPLTQPELDAPVFEIGQPYHFSLKVPVITPVELGDYSSLHFEREDADVTSEEVEQELESLRNRQATWHEVERPADYGDRVTVDLKLTIEDKTISDLKDNPFELTQERHGLFTGMDEHIVGMQVGESKEFTTTLPTDYTNQDLDELRDKVINAVIERSQITIHPLLIQEQAERMLHQLSHLLEQQHMSLDQYLMMVRKTREEYLKEIQPEAEKRVKRELVLDAVSKKENIEVLPEELEGLLRLYVQAGQEVSTEAQMRALAVTYRREKAIKRLLELTTDPDPDEESSAEENEESTIANAEAAVLAGEPVLTDTTDTTGTQAEVVEIEEPEVPPAPAAGETIADVVE